jgi:two-component system response regulator FixJ
LAAERVIYIVDDDRAVRRSLQQLLNAAGFQTVSYATPNSFLASAPSLPAGCVLIDLHMPEMGGLELQAHLLRVKADLPVIVVTGQGDVQSAVRAMKAGAADFIEKPYTDDVLIGAIEAALDSGGPRDRTSETVSAKALIETLSPRERQVLDALVAGHANKTIAFDLGISVRTVEVHRARMMDRLGVRQLAEAVRLAVLARLAG